LRLSSDDPEYAIWAALREKGFAGRLDYAPAEGESAWPGGPPSPPCLVVTMSPIVLPDPLRQRYPFRTEYAVMSVSWSEEASHWSEIARFDFVTQTSRVLPGAGARIPFDRRVAHLFVRTPRPSTLHLAGSITDGGGVPIATNRLRVVSDAGGETVYAVAGGPTSFAVSIPPGGTRIRLALLDPLPGPAAFAELANTTLSLEP
jgi:hypothetical protein